MTDSRVMERLRTETRDLHTSAEGKAFQRRMASGDLTRNDYLRWLGQMLHVHRALEAPLRQRWSTDPAFAPLREEQFQEPYLLEDLGHLNSDPAAHGALPATAALVSEIQQAAHDAPLTLLGFHYVLEGSNNGNRFIVRRLIPALGLADGRGHRYLDPYGDSQPLVWSRFKQDMDAVGFDEAQADVLVAAARRMFEAIGEISDELENSLSGRAVPPGT
jgi:heme oxygenase